MSGNIVKTRVTVGAFISNATTTLDSFTGGGTQTPENIGGISLIIDGFESVSVPAGVYPNAIRLKRIENLEGLKATSFLWYSSGTGLIKFEQITEENGKVKLTSTHELKVFSPGF